MTLSSILIIYTIGFIITHFLVIISKRKINRAIDSIDIIICSFSWLAVTLIVVLTIIRTIKILKNK